MIIWLATLISYALNVNDILKHCNKILLHYNHVFIFLWKVRSGMVAKWWSRRAHNPKVRGSKPRYAFFFFHRDSMAEWIRRPTTDQEIPGSSPSRVDKNFFVWERFYTRYTIAHALCTTHASCAGDRNSVPQGWVVTVIHIYKLSYSIFRIINVRVLSERFPSAILNFWLNTLTLIDN